MQIGFFTQGEGPHTDIARHLIDSAKKHMPDVTVHQMTDEKTPVLPGAKAIRLPGKMPMGVRRIAICASLPGNWIFCDTDVLFRRDVRDVFDKPFDLALASREGTLWAGTDYAKQMPYNTGVVFSKNPECWQAVLDNLLKMAPNSQEWGGEQYLIGKLAQGGEGNPFSIEILPSSYNFTPATKEEDVSHAAILHLKGKRKAWTTTYL